MRPLPPRLPTCDGQSLNPGNPLPPSPYHRDAGRGLGIHRNADSPTHEHGERACSVLTTNKKLQRAAGQSQSSGCGRYLGGSPHRACVWLDGPRPWVLTGAPEVGTPCGCGSVSAHGGFPPARAGTLSRTYICTRPCTRPCTRSYTRTCRPSRAGPCGV